MKKLSLILSVLLLILASCSSTPEKETVQIKPDGVKFQHGDFKEYIEFVDQPCDFTFTLLDHGKWGNFSLKTTVKLVEDVTQIDGCDKDLAELINVISTINLITENGPRNDYSLKLEIRQQDEEKLADLLLKGKKGDAVEVIYESDSGDVPRYDMFKKVIAFTPDAGMFELKLKDGAQAIGVNDVILPSQLQGKVEVTDVKKNISESFPHVVVTMKLLSTVNTSSMLSSYGQMWVAGIPQTENGATLTELLPTYDEWRNDDSDGNVFKSFLEGAPGETITLDFSGKKNTKQVELLKVKKFKLILTK